MSGWKGAIFQEHKFTLHYTHLEINVKVAEAKAVYPIVTNIFNGLTNPMLIRAAGLAINHTVCEFISHTLIRVVVLCNTKNTVQCFDCSSGCAAFKA